MKMILKIDKSNLGYFAGIGVIVLAFLVLLTFNIVGYGAQERCRIAQERHSGDCTEALMVYLQDGSNGFRARNSAVWALGQLGDARALPLLKSYYVGVPDGREPLDEAISQYELKKAIKLLEGGFNMTAWLWR
ncbi:HEAT repeat domain-containing protein [Patescibacteria group bacterium]